MSHRLRALLVVGISLYSVAEATEEQVFSADVEAGETCSWSGSSAGCSASAPVGKAGGSVDLPGVATITFPVGAFPDATDVSLEKIIDQGSSTDFSEFASIFQPSTAPSYFVVVDVGETPPVSETVDVTIDLPDWLIQSVPIDHRLELFARVLQDGGEESADIFELFPSQVDMNAKSISATLPTALFSQGRIASDLHYRAVLAVTATPGGSELLQTLPIQEAPVPEDSSCPTASIGCPVSGGCTVTSPFSAAREHPVIGGTRPHYGVDLAASEGTTVKSPAAGVIERSYTSSTFGETVVVRHSDGSASLVAHLSQRNVSEGQAVTKGQSVGLSGNTGVSEGPHVHFEYVPNGAIIQSKNRIDPAGCLEPACTGPNCECCIAHLGCPGETGCSCGIGCCCCPAGQACSPNWDEGCIPVGACLLITAPSGESKCIGGGPDPLYQDR